MNAHLPRRLGMACNVICSSLADASLSLFLKADRHAVDISFKRESKSLLMPLGAPPWNSLRFAFLPDILRNSSLATPGASLPLPLNLGMAQIFSTAGVKAVVTRSKKALRSPSAGDVASFNVHVSK